MRNKIIFTLAGAGIAGGCLAAYLFGIEPVPPSPVFAPPANPYANGIYAEGMVESDQPSGANLSVYPEVAGTVKTIFVAEGQKVRRGQPLLLVDDSIERAAVEQLHAQAEASHTMLEELKAQPRAENLDVANAQVTAAEAALKTARETWDKQNASFRANPKSVSRDALDSAANAALNAQANLLVAEKQRDLTRAGAWVYDVRAQDRQRLAAEHSFRSASALLAKYTLRAPADGVVLAINTIPGAFVSPQGSYDPYTAGMNPVLSLGSPAGRLNVRVYVDEILVPRLPPPERMKARMLVRGSTMSADLSFVRIQPLVSPKIELSNQRAEKVDVRVLPVIFRIANPSALQCPLYPGLLVDVYIGQ